LRRPISRRRPGRHRTRLDDAALDPSPEALGPEAENPEDTGSNGAILTKDPT
jgi:hypothetical protein